MALHLLPPPSMPKNSLSLSPFVNILIPVTLKDASFRMPEQFMIKANFFIHGRSGQYAPALPT